MAGTRASRRLIGRVGKRHGFRGSIKIYLDWPAPADGQMETLFIDGEQVPFFVERFSAVGKTAIAKLEDVDNADAADALVGKVVYVDASANWRDDRVLELHSLAGYQVFCGEEYIGSIKHITPHPLNPLLVVSGVKELLIPDNDHFIKAIDEAQQKVFVELPDGFMDL